MIVMLPCSRCGEMFRPKRCTQHRCISCIKAQPNHRPLPRFCECGKQITMQRKRYCNACIDEKQKKGLEIGYQKIHQSHYQHHHKITTPIQPLRERIDIYRNILALKFPVVDLKYFEEICDKVMKYWKKTHVNPKTITAAIFYAASVKNGVKISQVSISKELGVSDTSLRNWYKKIDNI